MGKSIDWRLMQIIEDIKKCADRMLEEQDDDLLGCVYSYAETLCIIQEKLSEEERKIYKLDFDIEKKYN